MRIIPKAGELSNGGTHPGAFQNGGENFRHSYRAKDEIDFWRRDEVPPPKINRRKGIGIIVVLLLPRS